MPARLILNADDFGLTPGINQAVEELHQAGALTSATLMATGPAFDDAAVIAQRNPNLGIGCHLVFVDGIPAAPLASIPSLLGANRKAFRTSLLDFVQATLRGAIDPEELARETQAQLQILKRAGINVTHIDSHKHTHLFPAIAGPVLAAARRSGVHAFRYPYEPRWSRRLSSATPGIRRLEQAALDLFEPRFRSTINLEPGAHTTHGTLGIAATGSLNEQTLHRTLAELEKHPEGIYELCCHPGFNDAALSQQSTRLRSSREVELRALLQVIPKIGRSLDSPQLIHYGSLGRSSIKPAPQPSIPATGYAKVL